MPASPGVTSSPAAQRLASSGDDKNNTAQHSEEVVLRIGVTAPPFSSTTGRTFRPNQPVPHQQQSVCYDNYGFRVTPEEKAAESKYNRESSYSTFYVQRWEEVSLKWDMTSFSEKRKLCRQGIPQKLRSKVWQQLLGTLDMSTDPSKKGLYESLHRLTLDSKVADVLERDLDRTLPTHCLFDVNGQGKGQEILRRMLRAYASHNTLVGYCQGMGFLASTLLLQIEDEEKSFWALCSLMERYPYQMEGLYEPGFPQLRCCFYVLDKLLQQQSSKLAHHFDAFSIEPSFYATHWFMTVFTYHFNFSLISRIWDMFLCEGWKPVYRVSLALLLLGQKQLLSASDQTAVLTVLRGIHENKNPDALLKKAQSIRFKTAYVQKHSKKFRNQ